MIYGRGDHLVDHLSRVVQTIPVFASVGLRERSISPIPVEELVDVLVAALGDRLPRTTAAVRGAETLLLSRAVRRVAALVGRRVVVVPMPVAFHRMLGRLTEATMRVPLVATAQVRMLAEGVTHAAPPTADLPDDLRPRQPFDRERITAALPPRGGFTLADLLVARRRTSPR